MSRTFLKYNDTILALARDAYGNGIGGNQERSLLFMREVIRMLELQRKVIESKADARATLAFDSENRRIIREEADVWPRFDRSLMAGSIEQWAAKGLTPNVLPSVQSAVLDRAREAGEVSVQLSGKDAEEFMADLTKS